MFTNISAPYFASLIFIFFIGASIGSFLNLVIYRLPLKLSIVQPRSHCPLCKKNIPLYGLIPILGFFLLLGQCFYCKTKISWRYPLIEALCGSVTLILYVHFFNETKFIDLLFTKSIDVATLISFLTALWLFYTGVVLTAIDIKYRILPDVIIIPGSVVGLVLSALNPQIGFLKSLIGVAVGFGGLFLVTKLYEVVRKQQGMGFGDVKYLGFIGAVVGALGVFYTLFMASVVGSVIGIIYGVVTKKGLKASIPFGPFLAVSAFVVYLFISYGH